MASPDRVFGKQAPASMPPTQSSGEPERVAGSPKDLDVSGVPMQSRPKAARRAAPPSGAGTWGKHHVCTLGNWAVVGNTAHKSQK